MVAAPGGDHDPLGRRRSRGHRHRPKEPGAWGQAVCPPSVEPIFGRSTDFPSRTAWAIGEIELGPGFTTPAAFEADY